MTDMLLVRHPGPATKARIANFGIELEVLRPGESPAAYMRAFQRHDLWDGDFGGEQEVSCYCDSRCCQGWYMEETSGIHEYHCDCHDCDYRRSSPDFAAQEDGTVGMEWVSRILHVDDDADVLDRVVEAHEKGMVDSRWRPDGRMSNGNHIHVSRNGTDNGHGAFRYATRKQAVGLVTSLFSAPGDWEMVAAGGCPSLRQYNGEKPVVGETVPVLQDKWIGWVSDRTETVEFRLWNTPSKASRIKAHVGLSVAILRWAYCQVIHDRGTLSTMGLGDFSAIVTQRKDDIREAILSAVPAACVTEATEAMEAL